MADPAYTIDRDSVQNGQQTPYESAKTSRCPANSPAIVKNLHICLGLQNQPSIYITPVLYLAPNWDYH